VPSSESCRTFSKMTSAQQNDFESEIDRRRMDLLFEAVCSKEVKIIWCQAPLLYSIVCHGIPSFAAALEAPEMGP
jgi:hypothetical protein